MKPSVSLHILEVLKNHPDEWLTHFDVYRKLPDSCKQTAEAKMSCIGCCRRLHRLGKIKSKTIKGNESYAPKIRVYKTL